MTARPSLLDRIARHRRALNLATLIACGLWAGWIAWMTRPAAIDAPASRAAWCTRTPT
ncbi:hypothetical protein Bsp3421_000763 [Burkholderia sp. FERM BP-3421]|jgi:hypothetical protein|uniref:hypothetical protein n=1 Tax=Burkholderia sp. FERM BP-3421 TaxID=1494466 RepID=UPI002362CC3E|nr:hypothetical protein [Burkholderia sp. FERM BP-3421]WDD90882.1 hypothetical protein Bsp3421_000763 [Burkholderia sp. FERM BP-3421]